MAVMWFLAGLFVGGGLGAVAMGILCAGKLDDCMNLPHRATTPDGGHDHLRRVK